MKKFQSHSLTSRLLIVMAILILLVVFPLQAFAYNENYSRSGTYNNSAYTYSGSCNEFRGTAKTTYGKTAALKIEITGYYVYVNNAGREIAEVGFKTFNATGREVQANVNPTTWEPTASGDSGMCKISTIHTISGGNAYTGSAEFQSWP